MDPNIPPYGADMARYANYGRLCLSLDWFVITMMLSSSHFDTASSIYAQTSIETIEAYLLRVVYMLSSKDLAAHVKVFSQLGLIWRLIISMGMRTL